MVSIAAKIDHVPKIMLNSRRINIHPVTPSISIEDRPDRDLAWDEDICFS